MATEFAMPTPATTYNTSPQHYTLYSSQAQPISPISSVPPTPQATSPTSPRNGLNPMPHHTRQLRPPKSPLYVPAVLRPTEPPRRVAKPSPITPPTSTSSSFDNLFAARPLTRRSTGDSGKFGLGQITESEWSMEGLGKVTDMPTRKHWKPDCEAALCDDPTCTRAFTYFTRRHHCRRCGNIFCDAHSPHAIPLDQDANYHPGGIRSRACEFCFSDYKGWEIARSSRTNSESSGEGNTPGTPTMKTPNIGCKGKLGPLSGVFGKGEQAQSLGASVPRDWNWSTF